MAQVASVGVGVGLEKESWRFLLGKRTNVTGEGKPAGGWGGEGQNGVGGEKWGS